MREVLSRHILVDGYHMVQDIEKSHGVFLHDAVRGARRARLLRPLLDLAARLQPSQAREPASSPQRILPAALNKPANSDIYTTLMAEFVETFARTVPEAFRRHLFFIEGGALAVENALKAAFDWKVRKNLARRAGARRVSRSSTSARPSTAAAATRCR